MSYAVGRAGFGVNAAMRRPKRLIQAELYISCEHSKQFFHMLRDQASEIEQELGYPLIWDELPNGSDCRISVELTDVEPDDESGWPHQHEWLAKRLNEFHRVFYNRVRTLDAADWDGSA
jgi:hypothetical protein